MTNGISRTFPALAALALSCLALGAVQAQPADRSQAPPAPRWPDGRVNLGAPPGETGMWVKGTQYLAVNPKSYEPKVTQNARINVADIPLQPWARALLNYRNELYLSTEPYTRCKPSGGARLFVAFYGMELMNRPELKRVYMFIKAASGSYRIIYTDGRGHPKNPKPTYFGHSVGHWEGDTLVVDTVGFNERFWMSREGLPHTNKLHLIERITRTSFDTLDYQVTVDDPGAYTAPWTSGLTLHWRKGEEVSEYVCQENNRSPQGMFKNAISRIAP
jgi:hypothetical protein